VDHFPADALKVLLQQQKMDIKPYFFDAGEFQIGIITPTLRYFLRHEEEMNAARKSAKRNSGTRPRQKPRRAQFPKRKNMSRRLRWSCDEVQRAFQSEIQKWISKNAAALRGKEIEPIDPGRSEYD